MLSEELRRVCTRMIDPRLGIVRRVVSVPLQPGEPRLFIVAAHCTRPRYFARNDACGLASTDYTVPAGGAGFEYEEALWRALGEAAERYAAGICPTERLVTATRRRLGERTLPVERLIGFSDEQYSRAGFPFARFDPDAPMRWIEGWNLTRGTPSFLPASLVYLGYEALSPQEILQPGISSGMAAGRTLEQALLGGILELVERDAFMAAWLLRHVPRALPECELDALLAPRERELLHHPGFRVLLFEVTTDIGLPAVIALVQPRNRRAAVVGAGAGLALARAAARALVEAFQTLNWAIVLERTPRVLAREDVRDFADHVRFYLDPANFAKLEWFFESVPRSARGATESDASPRDSLSRALAHLERAGFEIHYVETTTPDLRCLGFRTVRVLIPGLHPLGVGWNLVHEDTRRLACIARHWGVPMPRRLNSDPHPFP